MNRDSLLKSIAETGYNVGFGGRKHWATYDIVNKIPGLIGFIGTAAGVFSLVYESLSAKNVSATMALLGVVGIYISAYDSKKSDYEKVATEITQIFNGLRDLYRQVEALTGTVNFDPYSLRLANYESQYYNISISKQILFSDWYAHYKFFWQYQIDWVQEQKKFSFCRDKVPLTAWLALGAIFLSCALWGFSQLEPIKSCLDLFHKPS
ncbi:SLATT domain-containing protein [Pseudomonas alliivorans]|nr:SLATT domain-containing protein [Pseudomonas alliivorans]MEE4703810.1 SLATT domain-containing protein [Pseudomonas alliivorans]MEE4739784.1 SLATT domain-containing protein [Pseudomonas alliivorans]